ncbi:hypothetical protein [Bradyrhizobium sp. LB11.1]|jgi:hypothetical protein|uniref:hypothetical protein n=1 Tax=Bradyrhizobium sp. LB11.1 TaxID=3156326 RepID=UPI0033948CB7
MAHVRKTTHSRKPSAREKTSARRSTARKSTKRAGKTLPKTQRERLEKAKVELTRAFGRE